MSLNRRQFLLLGATFAAGCAAPGVGKTKIVNAGPAAQYLADGVYARYRDLGFFLVRRGGNLFALSSICTHKKCTLEAEPDQTFYCPCHGSTFDAGGHVTEGPARRDLPVFEISTDEKGELLVKITIA
jgi:Rieske Fe-S protein